MSTVAVSASCVTFFFVSKTARAKRRQSMEMHHSWHAGCRLLTEIRKWESEREWSEQGQREEIMKSISYLLYPINEFLVIQVQNC